MAGLYKKIPLEFPANPWAPLGDAAISLNLVEFHSVTNMDIIYFEIDNAQCRCMALYRLLELVTFLPVSITTSWINQIADVEFVQ